MNRLNPYRQQAVNAERTVTCLFKSVESIRLYKYINIRGTPVTMQASPDILVFKNDNCVYYSSLMETSPVVRVSI